jgi:hypothetical protein
VPFFVKAPGQRDARVDDRLVPTLAVVPTVAGLLGARVPWPHEGRSALHGDGSTEVAIPRRDFSRVVAIGRGRLERKRRDLRLRRARKFGSGALSELFLGDPWAAAYRIGPHPELLGRTPGRVPAAGARARAAGADLLRAVGERGVYPTRVVGRIDGGRARSTRDLAVAVNGRIEALGRSFRLRGQEPEYLSLMLPERALRPGRNQLVLLEVRGGRLRSLGRY